MFHGTRQGSCKIATDDFNRADGDSLGANWSEEAGDADIDSSELLWAATGIAIHQTVHPGGATAPARVKVRFKRSATTEYARVILGRQDSSNYLYASVETVSGCDVLRLFKVVGGTATEIQDAQTIGDGAPVDVWHTLEACLEPGNYPTTADIFRAKVTLAGGKVYGTQSRETEDLVGGTKGGIAGSANVRMDDFRFDWMEDETEPCKAICPNCKTQCLIETDDFPGGSETACKWSSGKLKVFHPELGTNHYATATFDLADGENAEVRVNMTADGASYHWAKLALSGTTLTLTIGKTGTTLDTKSRGSAGPGTYTLTVCFDGNLVTGGGGALSAAKPSTVVDDGIYAGRAGTADFTYFEFQKHFAPGNDSVCPNCEEPTVNCTACCSDLPFYMAVEITANLTTFSTLCDDCVTLGGTECGGCEGISGTYLLVNQENAFSNPDPCTWLEDFWVCERVDQFGPGWCINNGGFGTWGGGITMRVSVLLRKNFATGKCYWEATFLVQLCAGGFVCYTPAESGSCDCSGPGGCAGGTADPGCVQAPCQNEDGIARYRSSEFDVGECPTFPVTLNKIKQTINFPCKGDWPDTITIQPA